MRRTDIHPKDLLANPAKEYKPVSVGPLSLWVIFKFEPHLLSEVTPVTTVEEWAVGNVNVRSFNQLESIAPGSAGSQRRSGEETGP